MNRFLLIILLLFLVSCTSNTIYKKPKNLIPKDTMVDLLTDMMIATSSKYIKNKNLQTKVEYMALVYDKYKIDSTRFKESNIYYTSKIDEYEEIHKQVKTNLEKRLEKLKKQQKKQDSITVDSLDKPKNFKELDLLENLPTK